MLYILIPTFGLDFLMGLSQMTWIASKSGYIVNPTILREIIIQSLCLQSSGGRER